MIEIRPILSGTTVIARHLMGNLSRELNFGEKQWMTMKSNVSYAEFDVLSEVYSLTNDSIGDNVLLLPMALAIPMWRFRIAYASRCSDTDWNITMDESSLIFDAMNKTDSDQRIRIDFNDKGVVNDLLETYANGTTKFHMSLESTYDPNSNYDILITILIFSTIGVAIAIIVAVLFKKYNINVRDLFKGVKKARDAESTDPGSPAEEDDAF